MANVSPTRRIELQVSAELPEEFKDQRVRHRDFKRKGRSSGRSSSTPLSAQELEAIRSSLSLRFDTAATQNTTEQTAQGIAADQTTAGSGATNNPSAIGGPEASQASQASQASGSVQDALSAEVTNVSGPEARSNGGSGTRGTRAGTHARRSRSVGAILSVKTRTASRVAKGGNGERVTRRRFSKRRTADSLVGQKVELKEVPVVGRQTRGSRGAATITVGAGRRRSPSSRVTAGSAADSITAATTSAVLRQASPGSQGQSHEP